jgi:hypothetical protein
MNKVILRLIEDIFTMNAKLVWICKEAATPCSMALFCYTVRYWRKLMKILSWYWYLEGFQKELYFVNG